MMTLKVGLKAPDFTLMGDCGNKVSLKDFRGKTVVLYFYPRDMTPGCTTQACDFRDQLATESLNGIVVIGVSRDSVESHKKFKEKYQLNFSLLSDSDGLVTEKYGVWQEKNMYGRKSMGIVRTTFVIDPKGVIQRIYEKVKVKDHGKKIFQDCESL